MLCRALNLHLASGSKKKTRNLIALWNIVKEQENDEWTHLVR